MIFLIRVQARRNTFYKLYLCIIQYIQLKLRTCHKPGVAGAVPAINKHHNTTMQKVYVYMK